VGGVRECVSAELCAQWLEDCGLRLLSVLALDRFGDWAAGDRVTAPVRETAAQALAVTVRAMGGGAAEAVARALLTMAGEAVWEVRHGALLALKYTLAARAEMPPSLLPLCAPPLVEALGDADDDVRGAAASALLGVGAQLRPTVPLLLPQLLGAVWAALVKLDDLTASTGSVMMLGAKLSRELPYAQLCAAQAGDEDAAEAVRQWEGREQECLERGSALFLRVLPRLWPFLRHPAADTRCAAVATLHSLVTAAAYAAPPTWLPPLLPTALRLLLQAAFLDPSDKVHAAASDAWHALLTHAPLPSLRSAAAAHRAGWLALASIPPGGSLDPALLLCPSYEGGHDDAAAAKAAEAAVASAEAQARVAAALGSLASVCGLKDGWEAVLRDGLGSASTTRRQLAAWTVAEWAAHARRGGTGGGGSAGVKEEALAVKREVLGVGEDGFTCPSLYSATCLCLSSADACCEVAPELAPCLAVLRAEATNLTTAFERAGLPRTTMTDGWPRGGPLSLAGAEAILGSLAPAWEAALRVPANAASRIRCREAREMLAGAAAALRRAKSELLIQARRAHTRCGPMSGIVSPLCLMPHRPETRAMRAARGSVLRRWPVRALSALMPTAATP
jgi:TATA-binding protein-associated factor